MGESYSSRGRSKLSDYSHLRTIPAFLSIAYSLMSLYLFSGISEVHNPWFGYTLTTQHAVLGSLLVYVVAFASSETKAFDMYDGWEKGAIAVPPVLMLAQQYTTVVPNAMQTHDPWLYVVSFIVSVIGWAVLIR